MYVNVDMHIYLQILRVFLFLLQLNVNVLKFGMKNGSVLFLRFRKFSTKNFTYGTCEKMKYLLIFQQQQELF